VLAVIIMSLASPNPYDSFNFAVDISSVAAAQFSECVLPAATIEVIEYREGPDVTNNIHKLPGLVRYGNLVLKRGFANSMVLWSWFSSFATGTGALQTITVTLRDSGRNPVIKWSFTNCWPVKYESPVLNARASALAIETLEIAVDTMTVSSAPSQ
jgi:phage tail-like protein